MASAEKYSWGSLITTGLIFFYFQMRMLDGWDVVEASPQSLIGLYVTVVIMFTVAEVAIAIASADMKKGDLVKDERDLAIETRAEQFSNWFLVAAINVIVFHAIAAPTLPPEMWSGVSKMLAIDTPERVFFVLFSVLVGATLVQRISTVLMYRLNSKPNAI